MKVIIWDFINTIYDPSKKDLYPGVQELLSDCKGLYKQALVSMGIGASDKLNILNSYDIAAFFDLIKFGKKSPILFMSISRYFQASPTDCYVIGDNIIGEIKIGLSLQMKTILISNQVKPSIYETLFHIKPFEKVTSLKEVREILIPLEKG